MTKPLIIGLGNMYRGDDAVGLEIAEIFKERMESAADVLFCHGDTMELIDQWQGKETVFIIDAVNSGERDVGFVHRYDINKDTLPAIFMQSSTHLLGIAQAVELSKNLGTLPEKCILYGIEGNDFGVEKGVSSALKEKMQGIVEHVEREIRNEMDRVL